MEFNLEYKLQQFKEVERDYFDKNGERYDGTPIGKKSSEMMLQLINELSGALANAETELRQLTIPVVSNNEVAVCDICENDKGLETYTLCHRCWDVANHH